MPPFAIVDCDVLTPTRRIPHGLVLGEGGMIRAVGRSQDISLPPDIRLIDARGGWITPGLIDLAWREEDGVSPDDCGISSYAQVVVVQSERDLPALAAALPQARFRARPLGLHVVLGDAPPAWDDLWAAADAAIAVVTLSPAFPDAPALLRRLLAARIPCIFDWGDAEAPALDPLAQEMLASGLAATTSAADVPFCLSSPAALSEGGGEGMLLASAPDRPLHARDLYALSRQGRGDFAALLAAASAAPARFLRLAQGRLSVGAPADLLCWTRFGEPAWVMVGGEIEGDGGGAGRVAQRREPGTIAEFLRGRGETIAVMEEGGEGVDLVWRYRRADGREERAAIAVQVDDSRDDGRFRFETRPDRPNSVLRTQADWYFYQFAATGKLYCLPVRGLRAWLERHQEMQPVAVVDVMAALPRARLVEMPR